MVYRCIFNAIERYDWGRGRSMAAAQRGIRVGTAVGAAILCFAAGAYFAWNFVNPPKAELGAGHANAQGAPSEPSDRRAGGLPIGQSVELSETQLKPVKVEPVTEGEVP